MKIWLIKEGEPLPCDDNPRLMRTGMLAEYLQKAGHQVTWWTSTFFHQTKAYRYDKVTVEDREDLGRIVLLHSKVVYKKNISFQRIIYFKILGKQFYRAALKEERPDIIVCSYPSMEFAAQAVKFGKAQGVPVIIDVRDMWPDIFVRGIPAKLRFIAPIILKPFYKKSEKIFGQADAIVGAMEILIEWAKSRGKRKENGNNYLIPIGYSKAQLSDRELEEEGRKWTEYGINRTGWNICYIGLLNAEVLDMMSVLKGFKRFHEQHPETRLVLCGQGNLYNELKKYESVDSGIIVPGWINRKQILCLLSMSNIGLYPFRNTLEFRDAFGNKVIEYMANGLPVLSCLEGYSKKYFEKYKCGQYYVEGNENSFLERLEYCYSHTDEMKIMAQNAKACFLEQFDSEVLNARYEEIIKKLTVKQEV